MNDKVIVAVIVNILYLIIWKSFQKIRNSNNVIIKEWDNGNEFYESLNNIDKNVYWEQDTHILNIVFSILLIFIECTLFLVFIDNNFWVVCILIGLILSYAVGIFMSIKLQKRFK